MAFERWEAEIIAFAAVSRVRRPNERLGTVGRRDNMEDVDEFKYLESLD